MNKILIPLTGLLLLAIAFIAPATAANQLPDNYAKHGPGIDARYLKKCPVSHRFDFPVGAPHGKGYYNAQGFGKNLHLGDDWNGVGGGDTDFNDPIYSISDGIVVLVKNYHGKWGNVVRVLHNIGSREKPEYIEALYAHMHKVFVQPGQIVKRGQRIATIGKAGNVYKAHLHLEIRSIINMPLGGGYSRNTHGYLDPSQFIRSHR